MPDRGHRANPYQWPRQSLIQVATNTLFDTKFLSEIGAVDFSYTEQADAISFNHYEDWVEKGLQGPLSYLADERKSKRKSIKEIYPEFQSALVFLFPYVADKKLLNELETDLRMASYAFAFDGEDYHYVLRDKMKKVSTRLELAGYECNPFEAIDTKPVLERDLALRAGLGWIGKNSMLINQKHGSYFIIASLFLDIKLPMVSNNIETDHCGTCTKCIDACPTDCILDNKTIDASRCISTFTIEMFKDCEAPKGFDSSQYFFGCDICQDVCPWNNKPLEEVKLLENSRERQQFFSEFFLKKNKKEIILKLESMSNREYQRVFKGTSFQRTGRLGLLKNLKNLPG
jgi:epoxyqueuosine reductase